jgi:MFS transporter, FHS family, glucose/mannose:H+ symporter
VPFLLIRRRGAAAVLGCAGYVLIGWTGLLVPSLIRSVEDGFRVGDTDIGIYYFIYAVAYAAGSLLGGLITERLGRRLVLSLALVFMAAGYTALALVATWPLFLLAAIPAGLGGGAIDGGVNGLILDLYPDNRGRALSAVHLFFGVGALSSPFIVGLLVDAGVAWQPIFLASSVAMLPIAAAYLVTDMPSGHHRPAENAARVRVGLALPLIALGVAIAAYVAAEIGVSSWLVRYLAEAPVRTATLALSLFWIGLTLGRLLSALYSNRFDHVQLAIAASVVSGLSVFGAVFAPDLTIAVALFALAGFAFGPIYPMIMAVAGERFPARTAAVAGLLSSAAVVGGLIYPPVMGFMSDTVGLAVAMLGTGLLALACAAALWIVRRVRVP